jgi:hypothetical protein
MVRESKEERLAAPKTSIHLPFELFAALWTFQVHILRALQFGLVISEKTFGNFGLSLLFVLN